MRAGIDSTPEVQFGVLITIGILGHSLMEGAITVEDNDLGPVGKDVLGGIIGKYALCQRLILRPEGRTAIHTLTALIAMLERISEVLARAISTALEEEKNVFGIAFMQVDGG